MQFAVTVLTPQVFYVEAKSFAAAEAAALALAEGGASPAYRLDSEAHADHIGGSFNGEN